MKYTIPSPVVETLEALQKAGFEAHIVGGCVRDLILGREPKDWDITTDATPDAILGLFPDSFYENEFGTVGVKVERFSAKPRATVEGAQENNIRTAKEEKDVIEVTTYRTESGYSDSRRPDTVTFVSTLEEDLARRDFTMNALALDREGKLTDLHGGEADIRGKIIRTVGDPEERFGEDALRMMRAIRFFAELSQKTGDPGKSGKGTTATASVSGREDAVPLSGFPEKTESDWKIEEATLEAIKKHADSIANVSWERIRDEFSRIILSGRPSEGIELLRTTGLLRHIVPELEEGVGVTQNLHHVYTVWEHNLRALSTCPSKKLEVRLAALLHDVAKPRTKRGEGYRSTFYNHDHVGARMTRAILTRLRYPKHLVEKASLLVDQHLFYYNVGEVTEASVRRLIRRVGLENMGDLMDVRIGDRLGSGVPKAKPYKLRHLEYMIEKVSKDPVSVGMLAVRGTDLIDTLEVAPGPIIGAILDVLLAEVIEDPSRNVRESLLERAATLATEDIATLRERAKERIEEKREADDAEIKKTHRVG